MLKEYASDRVCVRPAGAHRIESEARGRWRERGEGLGRRRRGRGHCGIHTIDEELERRASARGAERRRECLHVRVGLLQDRKERAHRAQHLGLLKRGAFEWCNARRICLLHELALTQHVLLEEAGRT